MGEYFIARAHSILSIKPQEQSRTYSNRNLAPGAPELRKVYVLDKVCENIHETANCLHDRFYACLSL